jgi:hypothetical protein
MSCSRGGEPLSEDFVGAGTRLSEQPGGLQREHRVLLGVLSGCGRAVRAGGDLHLSGRYGLTKHGKG